MPELPEVETTRRGLLGAVKGRRIARVQVRRRDLRFPIPQHLEKALADATILDIRRRAKYLLIDLDTGQTVLAHLGMSGSFTVRKQGYRPQTHDHLLILLDNKSIICFNDPRRFGLIDLVKAGEEAGHKLLKNLGPEPFSKDFSPSYLKAQLAKRKGPIKPVLMDQKLVVGVGNIYASEALYLCGLRPDLPAHIAAPKAAQIIASIRQTLQAAIDSGGSTLRDYANAQNEAGYFQHQFRVYGRDGKPCFSCHASVKNGTHSGRATYWCPQCQRNA